MPSEIPTSLRRSLLSPLVTHGRAEEIERRLIEAIDLGQLRDGEQLPAESELAGLLGVAPMTLREALANLRAAGLVETRRGRSGGTFVRATAEQSEERLRRRLAARTVDELHDLGAMHQAVAAGAARQAAQRAGAADLRRLTRQVEALGQAATNAERWLADSRFHVEVALASGSVRLAKAETELRTDAQALTWLLSRPPTAAAQREHAAIVAAIGAGDGTGAAQLMHDHLERETARLIRERLALYVPAGAAATGSAPAAMAAIEAALVPVFDRLWSARGTVVEEEAAGVLAERIQERLDEPTGIPLAGMGFVRRTEAAGAASPWNWWRRAGADVAFLSVELDPRHPEHYDFASAEWFTAPLRTGRPTITGPFVDLGGADEHIFTLAVAVPGGDGDGVAVGVVGADVTLREVERIAVPQLATIGTDAVLVSAAGQVIAATSADARPGARWAGGRELATGAGLGWRIVAGA